MKLTENQLRKIVKEVITEQETVDDVSGFAQLLIDAFTRAVEYSTDEIVDHIDSHPQIEDVYHPWRLEDVERWSEQVAEHAVNSDEFKRLMSIVLRDCAAQAVRKLF